MRLLIHDYAGHAFPVQLSRELARRGHSVRHAYAGGLLTPRGSIYPKAGDPPTLHLTEIPMDANYRRDKYRFSRRRQMEVVYGRKVAAMIQQSSFDVVISGQTPTEPQYKIARACTDAGVPFIAWIQDFYSEAVAKLALKKLPLIGRSIAWWYRHVEKRTLQQAAAVWVITDDFVPLLRLMGVPAQKIAVIPNWAPLPELPQQPRHNAWSGKHGLDDKFVFLYAGTLAMKHNPDILWQLASSFRHDPAVRVVVISEGPGADYLRNRQRAENMGNLSTMPFQNFEKMPDTLATADVLVAVLEAEAGGFSVPSKVLTYHCAGKPILAAMPLGNQAARVIADEGSGLCVAPDRVASFLEEARKLRSDADLRQRCGEKARAYAERNFDIHQIADRFEQCIMRQADSSCVGRR